ncbi:MAG: amino acid racemase [Bryobacterales bacterium]|nr:amino acid racemase [Bryobacterales bacterium]MBV9401321.1 amino acid racemase [Bryobacterales bacterium]
MAQHIGIVACSAEGAALCYRTICIEGAALLGPHNHPEVSMHTYSLARYMEAINAENWQGAAELMVASAEKLAKIGADFLICPDNTIHRVLPDVVRRTLLPWLHIADCVIAEANERGFMRLGLTGTKFLMESDVYPEHFVRPSADERERMNAIIFEELVYGRFRLEALRYFQQVIQRMHEAGCDAVVLGCTEIPLLVQPEDSPLPVLDSTRLLARAALKRAAGDQSPQDPSSRRTRTSSPK